NLAHVIVAAGASKAPIGGAAFQTTIRWWIMDSIVLANLLWAMLIGLGCVGLARLKAGKASVIWLVLISLLLLLGASWRVSETAAAPAMYDSVIQNLTNGNGAGLPFVLIRIACLAIPFAVPIITLIILAFRKEWRTD